VASHGGRGTQHLVCRCPWQRKSTRGPCSAAHDMHEEVGFASSTEMHLHMNLRTQCACMYVKANMFISANTHAHALKLTHARTHMHSSSHMHAQTHPGIHTYVYRHKHTHIYSHILTCIHTSKRDGESLGCLLLTHLYCCTFSAGGALLPL